MLGDTFKCYIRPCCHDVERFAAEFRGSDVRSSLDYLFSTSAEVRGQLRVPLSYQLMNMNSIVSKLISRSSAAAKGKNTLLAQPRAFYHENIIDHYENPRNVGKQADRSIHQICHAYHPGSFDKTEKHIGTGLVGAPACGDVMKLQVRSSRFWNNFRSHHQIRVEDGKVVKAKFKTFGCGSAIASR